MQPFLEFMQHNWGWMLSFFTVMSGLVAYVFIRIRALQRGVQALLRAQMVNDFNHYSEKGFAPIYARENFENCWKQYEALGKNGVMSDIHNKFLALPTQRGDAQ